MKSSARMKQNIRTNYVEITQNQQNWQHNLQVQAKIKVWMLGTVRATEQLHPQIMNHLCAGETTEVADDQDQRSCAFCFVEQSPGQSRQSDSAGRGISLVLRYFQFSESCLNKGSDIGLETNHKQTQKHGKNNLT